MTGTVAEWTNAAALKAAGRKPRGFESLPFRQSVRPGHEPNRRMKSVRSSEEARSVGSGATGVELGCEVSGDVAALLLEAHDSRFERSRHRAGRVGDLEDRLAEVGARCAILRQ